jgi:sterol 14-demethylase
MLILSTELTHRSQDAFGDPDSYRPARYLEDPRARSLLVGFGGGVHRCLGMHFAYLEMAVVATMLLRHFDLELIDPAPQPVPGQATKWPASPCRVRYRRKVLAET